MVYFMNEIVEYARERIKDEYILFLIILSAIGFSLIAIISMMILAKINISQLELNFSGLEFFIFFILIIPFIAGSFF